MQITINSGDVPKSEAEAHQSVDGSHVWVAIMGDRVDLSIFLPAHHPSAFEAAQAIAAAFNSVSKPKLAEAA